MKRVIPSIALLALASVAAGAGQVNSIRVGDRRAKKSPGVFRMTVRPAAEPDPALKCRFLPPLLDRRRGNAALFYYRMLDRIDGKEDGDRIGKWLEMPPGKLPREEVASLLDRYSFVRREAARAARREQCDWQLPIREDGFATVLPGLSEFRHLGQVLALQARLQIAEGKLDEAVRTLQTGFSFARQVAEGRTLVTGLVGIHAADTMAQQVRALAQAPGAPNLYWALASLGEPTIDAIRWASYEAEIVFVGFPALHELKAEGITVQQWRDINREIRKVSGLLGDGRLFALFPTAVAMKLYPEAKKYLASRGYDRQKIEAMAVHQAIAIYTVESFERRRDDLFKWLHLPFWEAYPGMQQMKRSLGRGAVDPSMAGFPLTLLLTNMRRPFFVQARLDRRIAALRCIEAVRMYAAAHEGKLPARLSDVRQVPIPINPVTGKPFGYKVAGNTFTLEAVAPAELGARETDRYEVTLIAR
jgi:hypothetical protein